MRCGATKPIHAEKQTVSSILSGVGCRRLVTACLSVLLALFELMRVRPPMVGGEPQGACTEKGTGTGG